jgi:mannosyltransferase OCH1-like enzyme
VVVALITELQYRHVLGSDWNEPLSVIFHQPSADIAQIIHQTHKARDKLPSGMLRTLERTENLHPQCEYRYYDDEACRTFMEEYFSGRIFRVYEKLVPGAYKADLFRYCLLYIYGGVYIDADMYCLRSFESLIWNSDGESYDFISAGDLPLTRDMFYLA